MKPVRWNARTAREDNPCTPGQPVAATTSTGVVPGRLLAAVVAGLVACVSPARAQEVRVPASGTQDTIPADTYADPGVRRMIERARLARGSEAEGLESYEATITERIYVGLMASRFRRERGLFVSEQVARVRWSADGKETYRWLARRQEVPIAGDLAGDEEMTDERGEHGEDPDDMIPLDPTDDRLLLAGETFLHPLADSAGFHYRYESGDTMRIVLPSTGREITLVQVRIEPRRADFDLLAGAMWFDLESAALVRGAFRPARDFNLALDEPADAEDVPGFIKPITASVDHMIVDYALQDLRWWLPWRVRFEGVGRAGRILTVPVVIEVAVADYSLNELDTLDIAQQDLPPGWVRRTTERKLDDGRRVREVSILPPRDSLRNSDLLSEDYFTGEPIQFERAELDRMRRVLESMTVHETVPLPSLSGLAAFRYNRVEALSAGLKHETPILGSVSGWGEVRLGIGDLVPNVEIGLREDLPGGLARATAYYRLQAANDWGDPLNLESSVNAILLGYDFGQYYRAGGMSIDLQETAGRVRYDLKAFAEAHRAEEKHTDISLANLLGRADPPENMEADEIEVAGLAGRLRLQAGVDPRGFIWTGTAWGEVGVGGAEYGRAGAGVTAGHPLFWRLAASLEASAGTTFGDVPVQRLYEMASPRALRAFDAGQVMGESFWMARAELALGYPGIRLVTFGDFAWAGDRDRFGEGEHAITLGAGISALDGLLRIDLGRAVRGPGPLRWQLHVYLDALM